MNVVVVVIVERIRPIEQTPFGGVIEAWGIVRTSVQCLHGGFEEAVGVNDGSKIVEAVVMVPGVKVTAGGVYWPTRHEQADERAPGAVSHSETQAGREIGIV